MHPSNPERRRALTAVLTGILTPWALQACGGGSSGSSSSGAAQVRAINLTSDLASVDLVLDDTTRLAALATDTASDYTSIDAASYAVKIRRAGEATALLTTSYTVVKEQTYTAVVWGRENALRLHMLSEDADDTTISDGSAKLRVFNATIDAGSVDVYVTSANAEIADSTPLQAASGSAGLGGYHDLTSGSFRLRVTGAGDPADLRLDVASVTIPNRKYLTLVLTAGAGGVLLNALLLPLKAAATAMKNTKARLRVVAAVDNAASVGLTLNGQTFVGGYRSPTVGPYAAVDAGSVAATVRIDGASAVNAQYALAAGGDYTLLVDGSAAAPAARLLADDNRVPTTASRAKLRLVHGQARLDPLTLAVDYLPIAIDLAEGSASAYTTITSAAAARIDVTAASAAQPVYTVDGVNLQSGSVYTVFVLGGNAAPTGVIRKER